MDPHHQGGEHQRRLIGDFPKPRLDIPYFRSANRIGTTRQALRKIFVTSMAGPACDKFYGFDRDNSGDLRDARWAAEQMGGDIDTILETGRRDAEALIRRHEAAIRTLAQALLTVRSMELPGEQVERILSQSGVQRSLGRAPLPGQERYYERRGGVDRATANPDPLRKVAVFERRIDGWIGASDG